MPQQTPESDDQLVVFSFPGGEVRFAVGENQETIWGTRQQIAQAFGCTEQNVRHHIDKIYAEDELEESATCKRHLQVQTEGGRSVKREVDQYNLDVILSVGYRLSARKATEFRQWATRTLKQLITTGYVIDVNHLAANPAAQQSLAAVLRAIRHEERNLYAKVRDVFATSATDYDGNSQQAKTFFAMAQDKFIYAITEKTAAQIILERADASKVNMGLRSIKGEHPTAEEAKTGKNYLTEHELKGLENICEQFMLFTESKAFRGQKMTMEELTEKLNTLLRANDYPVLYKYEKYERHKADTLARHELERYRARIGSAKQPKQIAATQPKNKK